ncbi:hypothetical protein RDWZM_005443 [Blomia tropicalis]|uniref:Uncharacterized protein n=1 Tax=Blomia tropicalis TaxID=40697 RepID=A0A9Q0M5A0_BLOTA|nr:hypothetical protein RDWZM_005443 [Blomia tropicalis]
MDHCDTLNGPDGTMGIHNHTTRLDSIRFDSIRRCRIILIGCLQDGAVDDVHKIAISHFHLYHTFAFILQSPSWIPHGSVDSTFDSI